MKIDYKKSVPLYHQIVEDLHRKIASQEFKEGEWIGSQQDIASKYGVSLITARKAMAILINEGLLVGQVGRGMFVASGSRPAAKPEFKTIGLVLPDLQDPFFSRMVYSIEAKASEYGFSMLLSNSSETIEKEEYQIDRYRRMNVAGLIIASMGRLHHGTPAIQALKRDNFPFVMISFIEDPDIYYVGTDHAQGAFLATEHLIKLGHLDIGYISTEPGDVLGELRKNGYRRALDKYGMRFNEASVYYLRSNSYQAGYEIGLQFSQSRTRPTAIFAYDDSSALGFERAVVDSGLQIPEDVSLVGFDNIEAGVYAPVPLTTIHQPTYEIGCLAFEVLWKLSRGEQPQVRTILEPRLIVRKSCGATSESSTRSGISYN
jgi:DNA-binding LacI/PurR family transcriptional regulator